MAVRACAGNGLASLLFGKEIFDQPTFPGVGFFLLESGDVMRLLKPLLAFIMLAFLPAHALGNGPEITVAAASDLTFALKEIAANFGKEAGVKAVLTFGSTGMLARQIEQGAPFDIFLAADLKYLESLKEGGHIDPETIEVYAYGRLALAVNKPSSIEVKEIKDLLNPGIKRIAIANPAHAPYGRAAVEALKSSGVWEAVKGKLVFGENIRQALQFVQSGNAPAGIVALSIADVPEVKFMEIDRKLHGPIEQAAGVVAGSKEKALAGQF